MRRRYQPGSNEQSGEHWSPPGNRETGVYLTSMPMPFYMDAESQLHYADQVGRTVLVSECKAGTGMFDRLRTVELGTEDGNRPPGYSGQNEGHVGPGRANSRRLLLDSGVWIRSRTEGRVLLCKDEASRTLGGR